MDQYYLIMNGVKMLGRKPHTHEECYRGMQLLNICRICNNRFQIIAAAHLDEVCRKVA